MFKLMDNRNFTLKFFCLTGPMYQAGLEVEILVLSLHLHPVFIYVSSENHGESAQIIMSTNLRNYQIR